MYNEQFYKFAFSALKAMLYVENLRNKLSLMFRILLFKLQWSGRN